MASTKQNFKGRAEHALDEKSRVIVPIKWRGDLGDAIILCRSLDGTPSVWGFSDAEFNQFYDEAFAATPEGDIEGRRQLRLLSASSAEVEMDKQGRIPLPKHLRDHAVINNDSKGTMVAVLGQGNRFEIWDPALLDESLSGVDPQALLDRVDKYRKSLKPE